jgi:hypothetical protein
MRTIGVIQKRSSSTREKLGGQVPPSREDLDERLRGARELVAKAMKGGAGPPEMETALLDGNLAAALAEQGIELDLLWSARTATTPCCERSSAAFRRGDPTAPCPVLVVPRGADRDAAS